MNRWTRPVIGVMSILAAASVGAQHLDVKVSTSNGPVAGSKIEVDVFGDLSLFLGATGTLPIHAQTGALIFPTWFSDRTRQGAATTSTDNPGFQSFAGSFLHLEEIQFRALGSLSGWTPVGSGWSAAAAAASVRLSGGMPDEIALDRFFNPTPEVIAAYEFYEGGTRFSGTGITGPTVAPIGLASASGGFHDHWDWFLEGAARATPGAYLVEVQIISSVLVGGSAKYVDSDPFHVLFNNRLTNEQFNTALLSLTTPVPEPDTWALMLGGVGLLAFAARRSRKRSEDQHRADGPVPARSCAGTRSRFGFLH